MQKLIAFLKQPAVSHVLAVAGTLLVSYLAAHGVQLCP